MSSVEIIRPGLWSSVQDLGRFGYTHLGVPHSGVMDSASAVFANGLLNNPENAAVLEFTLSGPQLRFNGDSFFVLSGGLVQASCDGQGIARNEVAFAKAGAVLKIGAITTGSRGYLAVAGGFKTAKMLGSRSMYAPLTQAKLKKGDILPMGSSGYGQVKGAKIKGGLSSILPKKNQKIILEVYKGPEYDLLSSSEQEALLQPVRVSKLWNRMALQFEEKLQHGLPEIKTTTVLPGTVQCTPDGSLIVLLNDCQTTGGYPRLLQLAKSSLAVIGQLQTTDKVFWRLLL